jgi:VWFA-related protein
LIADLSDSRAKVEAAIDSAATPEGGEGARFNESTGTSFYDALFLAVEESPLKQIEGRKAIICMSDGVDSSSKTKYLDVAKLVEKSDASVYFLELNTEAVTLNRLLKPKSDPDYADLSQSQVDRYFDAYDADSLDRHRERKLLPHDLLTKINRGLFELARRQERELAQRTGGRVYPVRSLIDLAGVYKQVADDLRSQYSIGYYSNNDPRNGGWRSIRVEVRGKSKGASVRARSGYWAK